MFHTEELTQIIEQLKHADGNGYFDTLWLILQLIGLCIGPILFIGIVVASMKFLPMFLSCKRIPVPKDMKLYDVYFTQSSQKGVTKLKLYTELLTEQYKTILFKNKGGNSR